MSELSPLSKLDHIGIVVRDMDRAASHYESLGIRPFNPFTKVTVLSRELHGKKVPVGDIAVEVRLARAGPLDIELLRPVKGESLWQEFLQARGEGVQHLGFYVDDLDKADAALVRKGVKAAYRIRFESGGKIGGDSYMDTTATGGVLMALTSPPPAGDAIHSALAKCA